MTRVIDTDNFTSVIRKMIGERPVIRKINGNWVICNRFSGEPIFSDSLPNLISLAHGNTTFNISKC